MTPTELRTIRATLGLSAEAMASLLQVQSGRTVRRWEAGEREVPGPVAVILTALRESQAVRRYFGVSAGAE